MPHPSPTTCMLLVLILCGGTPLLGETIGFRQQGLGHHPQASLPTGYDVANGSGVLWSVEMPSRSSSTPLVIDDLVVTVASPELVLGFAADSGEERWRTTTPAVDGLPEADREQARELFAAGWAALEDYRKTPRKQRSNEQKNVVKKYWRGDLQKRWGMTSPNDFGWAMPSPVWDGERIIVRFETGVVAALDRAGQRQWLVQIPGAGGHETPLVVAGRVVVLQRDGKKDFTMVALDAASGREAWRSEALRNPHDSFGGGGPTTVQLGDRMLIVSHGGEVLDPVDGRILARCPVQGNCRASTPIAVDEVIYFPAQPDHGKGVSGLEAIRLGLDGSAVTATALWQTEPTGYETMTSPLWTGEHLMLFYSRPPYLWCFDPATGALLNGDDRQRASVKMSMHHPGPDPALVGGTIWVCDQEGQSYSAAPAAQPQLQDAGTIAPLGGTPAFVGDRIYARTDSHLVCIGR